MTLLLDHPVHLQAPQLSQVAPLDLRVSFMLVDLEHAPRQPPVWAGRDQDFLDHCGQGFVDVVLPHPNGPPTQCLQCRRLSDIAGGVFAMTRSDDHTTSAAAAAQKGQALVLLVVVVAVSVIFPPARTIADTSGPDQPTVRFEAVGAAAHRRRGCTANPSNCSCEEHEAFMNEGSSMGCQPDDLKSADSGDPASLSFRHKPARP